MENSKTLNFLKTAMVAVIASEDNKILKDFINHISDCNCGEFSIVDTLQYDCANHSTELKIATVNKIKVLKKSDTNCVLPVEFLHRGRFVTALLCSIFLRISESDQPDIQLFQLRYVADELRLECEFGENAGWYVVFDYNPATGIFREKE